MQGVAPVSSVIPADGTLHQLETGLQPIKALFHITRVPRWPTLDASAVSAGFLTCCCPPETFRPEVSHQTQEHSSKFLPT